MSSGEPVTWAPTVVRHSDDFNRRWENDVDDAEGKTAHDVAAIFDVESWPAVRRFEYRQHCSVNVGQKGY